MGGSTCSSSQMAYPQQLSTASTEKTSRRATTQVFPASPHVTYSQRQQTQKSYNSDSLRLSGFPAGSMASQMGSPMEPLTSGKYAANTNTCGLPRSGFPTLSKQYPLRTSPLAESPTSRERSPSLDHHTLSGSGSSTPKQRPLPRDGLPVEPLTSREGSLHQDSRILERFGSPTFSRQTPLRATSPANSHAQGFSRAVSPVESLASQRGSPALSQQARDMSPRTHDRTSRGAAELYESTYSHEGGILWGAGETSTRLVSLS